MSIRRRAKWTLGLLVDHLEGGGAVLIDATDPWAYNMRRHPDERDSHYVLAVDIMGPEGAEWIKVCGLEDTTTWVCRARARELWVRGRKGDRIWLLTLR
jgi:hypothetical protein